MRRSLGLFNFAAQYQYPWVERHEVITEPFTFTNGAISPPSGPGLGVSIDPDRLAALAANYRDCGVAERDDTAYMKQFDPTYERRVPRW